MTKQRPTLRGHTVCILGILAVAAWAGFSKYTHSQPCGRFTSEQILARTSRLCQNLGESPLLDGAYAEHFLARGHRAHPCWMVDGYLADGTTVFVVWNAQSGQVATLCLAHPSTAIHETGFSKAQITALARLYARTSMEGSSGFHGRMDTITKMADTWRVHGQIWKPGRAGALPIVICIDRKTGQLTGISLEALLNAS